MRYIFSFVLLLSLGAKAQWKSYIIGVKGDTLNRVDAKGLKQGPWSIHVDELRGNPGYEEEGYFVNDQKEGRWVRYSLQGDKLAIENYRWGQKDGKCQYFNTAEDLIRDESWLAANPKNPYDTIPVYDINDATKILRFQIVKLDEASVKHGTWRYYDPQTGRIEKTEQYVLNRLKTKDDDTAQADDELAPIDPATGKPVVKKDEKKQVAKPKEVLEYEKKNAGRKKIKVRDGSTGG
jgi:antitoxin component YwqK of YwqJK toxin-antitoxin module